MRRSEHRSKTNNHIEVQEHAEAPPVDEPVHMSLSRHTDLLSYGPYYSKAPPGGGAERLVYLVDPAADDL